MQRRKFLGIGLAAVVATIAPSALMAQDYRAAKPAAWTAHTVNDAIQALYGKTETTENGVAIKAPEVAANGAAVPVKVTSKLSGKSLALFQDSNPESAVAVIDLNENSIIDYNFNLKLKRPEDGLVTLTAVLEGNDGTLHSGNLTITVGKGGCDE